MEKVKKFSNDVQFIVIAMGDEQFGIDIKYIDNIVRMQHYTRVPNVAPYIKGVINLRGEVIPIMSVRIKMGLPEEEYTKSTRIIIIRLEQYGSIGFIVDEVREVLTLSEDNIERVSHDNKEEHDNFIFGIGKFGDSLVSLLDVNAVAIEKE